MVLYAPAAEAEAVAGAGAGAGSTTPPSSAAGGGGSFLSRPFVPPHIARIQPGAARSDALDVGMEVRESITYEDEAPDAWAIAGADMHNMQSLGAGPDKLHPRL
jgi:hypothetical protein